ncbi:type IV secretion system protein VirB2 [Candidatus Xenohaliotis californiensis]|uniref:Type IV secretion system protein VirB2 n=1 Tax=Candidatus Xenohaliotis californiensis TaxID=84677 RepID=A0ABM9N753_9RICK|nr:type IV secretion system protein VirB2 [Candidatus Xenohaliotis californiensis]
MIKNLTKESKITYSINLLLLAMVSLVAFDVFADSPPATDAITQAICNLEVFITGGPGKAVVVVVIVSTGFGMFFGKITWVTAIIILIGIGITFGGPKIVSTIVGGSFTCTSGVVAP